MDRGEAYAGPVLYCAQLWNAGWLSECHAYRNVSSERSSGGSNWFGDGRGGAEGRLWMTAHSIRDLYLG